MSRLPIPGADKDAWGDILNDFLLVSHKSTGALTDNTVGTSQVQIGAIAQAHIQDGAVTAAKTAPAVQSSLAAADSSVQQVNGKTPTAGSVTLVASDLGALTQTVADGRYVAGVKQTSAPSSPATNDLWYDSTNDIWKRWNGSAWRPEGSNNYIAIVSSANSGISSPQITREVADPNLTESKWREVFNTGSFNGHADPVHFFGWNADRAAGLGDAGAPTWYQGFEADYWNTASNHAFEWYMRYASPDNATVLQPLYVGVDRNGNGATNGYITLDIGAAGSGSFVIYNGSTADSLMSINATSASFTRPMALTAQGTNTDIGLQINAAGTGLATLKFSGRWNLYHGTSSGAFIALQDLVNSKFQEIWIPGTTNDAAVTRFYATPMLMGTQATSASAGSATALPATPQGYFQIMDAAGTVRKVPYYV